MLYLPGLASLPPIDRDEARFMQASKQMIETGDHARIRFQAEPRDKKPIGAHWLQAGAVNLLSPDDLTATWPYRLPSVIGAWLAVLTVAWTARRMAGPAAGLAAGVILATSILVIVEAHLAKADALLLAASTAALGALAAAYTDTMTKTLTLSFWAALGAGILIKGPILPAVVVLTLISLAMADRSLTWVGRLQPFIGVPIMVLIAGLWPFVAGVDEVLRFASSAFSQDLLPKLGVGVETHGAPPGTHLLAAFATLWPWSWAIPLAVVAAWRQREEPIVRLCLMWIVPFWLMLELTPTKLPHYPLPLFPALAILLALYGRDWPPIRVLGTALGGLAALILILAGTYFVLGDKVPSFSDLNVSQRLQATLTNVAPKAAPVIVVGYNEPSIVFLLGTETVVTNPEAAAGLLAANPDAVVAITEPQLPELEKFVTAAGQKTARLAEIPGYNYSRGAAVRLVVVKAILNVNP
jgi:4-amino-4-deoxy-L-arabinose transferase-like glycosyltransferase